LKVLFVGLDYHNYTSAIISEMEAQGCIVTFVDIQPRNFLFKVFRTLMRSKYEAFLRRHHERAVSIAEKTRYDHVVFLQSHQFEISLLARLRNCQYSVPFVLYNWDSLSTHNYIDHVKYFDYVFTFDVVDAIDNGFVYLPLFGTRYMQAMQRDSALPRTVFFVGNIVNPKRFEAIRAFSQYCKNNRIEFKAFMKITPVVYIRMLCSGLIPRGVSFKSIRSAYYRKLVESSVAVFDFANHQQSGHTMRTIENLVCGKKIITNNCVVVREPFFSKDRFHVYDGLDFSGVSNFIDSPIIDANERFNDYGIQVFTRRLLLLKKS
jgi:hypothetical protein